MKNEYYAQTVKIYCWGVIQSTSIPISPLACPEKNWLEDGLRSSHSVTTRVSIVKEFIPLYDWKSTSYHPGLDYCLICWCKSDVLTIEKILYEYSLKYYCEGCHIYNKVNYFLFIGQILNVNLIIIITLLKTFYLYNFYLFL